MSRTFTFTTEVERGEDAIEVSVTYSVTPFIAQTYWQPAEGGEVEIVSITPDVLTDAEEEALISECEGRARDDMADEAAEYADYRYEQKRDQQMMDAWDAAA